MDRFTEEQMVNLVAYQNLYGFITPRRLDMVLARLGMDVVSPHLKKGARPRLRDHLMTWSRADRPRRSGREMLGIVQGIQAQFEQDHDTEREQRGERARRARRALRTKEASHGGSR
uniref:Minor tail T domain-containing protein n=1 Tax=Streptomyces sp. NBC_00093 TaxID=2975649 RepID=A0AAU1ZZ93_9ACTN